jgi:hypothetical protein
VRKLKEIDLIEMIGEVDQKIEAMGDADPLFFRLVQGARAPVGSKRPFSFLGALSRSG